MNDTNVPQSNTNINNIETHMITIIINWLNFILYASSSQSVHVYCICSCSFMCIAKKIEI